MSKAQCVFCGGKACKYEQYTNWLQTANSHNAIEGLFSNWVGDDILAMARPSNRLLKEFSIVEQFRRKQVGAVMNLQLPGEHALCGDGLAEPEGFSYSPERFIDQGIFYYNFGWKDMTVPPVELALNAVQVMHSCIHSRRRKVAVHCHAGLGRTGLLIACYLVFCSQHPGEAIEYVRMHRPGSIQTRAQAAFIESFAQYLRELKLVFAMPSQHAPFTLEKAMRRQERWSYATDVHETRSVPKIVALISTRILELGRKQGADIKHASFLHSLQDEEAVDVSHSLQEACEQREKLLKMKNALNLDNWSCIEKEKDILLLTQLLIEWLLHLKEPVIGLLIRKELLIIPRPPSEPRQRASVDDTELQMAHVGNVLHSLSYSCQHTLMAMHMMVKAIPVRTDVQFGLVCAFLGVKASSLLTERLSPSLGSMAEDARKLTQLLPSIMDGGWRPQLI